MFAQTPISIQLFCNNTEIYELWFHISNILQFIHHVALLNLFVAKNESVAEFKIKHAAATKAIMYQRH